MKGDVVIITEPTSGPDGPDVVVAHGGALTYTIEIEGRSAHAAKRLEGVSALEKFWLVHRALRRLEIELNEQENNPATRALGLPYPTSVGVVRGGIWSASVMDHLTAEVSVGAAIGESDAAFGSSAIDPSHPLVETIVAAAYAVTGRTPAFSTMTWSASTVHPTCNTKRLRSL